MLDDRPYMRSAEFRPYRSAVPVLLIANAVLFVLQSIAEYYGLFPVRKYFYLSLFGLYHGYVWQLLTFQFLHGGLMHLLLNLLALYMFGRPVEDALGRTGFLKLYLMSGVLGGGLHVMAALILGGQFILPVVGASAGIFGLIAAFATLYPERPLTMLVAFIIPIEMRAKFLLLFEALIAVFGIIVPVGCVAHAAHLGGMLLGIAYIRWFVQAEQTVLAWRRRRPAPRPPVLARANAPKPVFWRQPKPDVGADLPPEEFISREVDPILDKISAQGIHSLTAQERRILELARAKMSKK